ncbi:unnamed protein product [Polarella glacialis]|uniref:Uncharacterized protein n=1 Tax=Polarella glacialis TaxID=89957 RepID=A0A813IVU6_POLGL|nr:unnamed protein product [Polarella glacialis]
MIAANGQRPLRKVAREDGYFARVLQNQDQAVQEAAAAEQPAASEEEELVASPMQQDNNSANDVEPHEWQPDNDDMASMVGVLLQLGLSMYEVHETISEIFSPPRVNATARDNPKLGFAAGAAYDLQIDASAGESWDFALASHRSRRRRQITSEKPLLVVVQRLRAEGLVLLALAAEICAMQARAGRYFLLEHPASADSWQQGVLLRLLAVTGVGSTVGDMCAFRMMSDGPDGKEQLVLKPTRWASNAPELLKRMGVRCSNRGGGRGEKHPHAALSGKARAGAAAMYPPRLCLDILRGLRDQLLSDGAAVEKTALGALCDEDAAEEARFSYDGEFVDDISGEALPKHLVEAGRKLEMKCRLVACQYNQYTDAELYATTPPLEALRFLISAAATSRRRTGRGEAGGARRAVEKKLLFVDARRAYFNSVSTTLTYVQLPEEDADVGRPRAAGPTALGASSSWSTETTSFIGVDVDLDWIQTALALKFEIKVRGRLGGGSGDVQEMRILNRVVQWSRTGITYEADQRHAELIIQQFDPSVANAVVAPGEKDRKPEEWFPPLDAAGSSAYKATAARLNFLSTDRPDIAYACKESCRDIGSPTQKSSTKVKHIARYLVGCPQLVYEYRFQEHCNLDTYVDSNYAGDFMSRKSTSGGCIMRGNHLSKRWSNNQSVIALSSESEPYGIVTGATQTVGIQSIAGDLSIEVEMILHTDSAAAKGVCERKGIGKVKHLAVSGLWIQDKVRNGEIHLSKVEGTKNPADVLTKHVEGHKVRIHLAAMQTRPAVGRAQGAPVVVRRSAGQSTPPMAALAQGTDVSSTRRCAGRIKWATYDRGSRDMRETLKASFSSSVPFVSSVGVGLEDFRCVAGGISSASASLAPLWAGKGEQLTLEPVAVPVDADEWLCDPEAEDLGAELLSLQRSLQTCSLDLLERLLQNPSEYPAPADDAVSSFEIMRGWRGGDDPWSISGFFLEVTGLRRPPYGRSRPQTFDKVRSKANLQPSPLRFPPNFRARNNVSNGGLVEIRAPSNMTALNPSAPAFLNLLRPSLYPNMLAVDKRTAALHTMMLILLWACLLHDISALNYAGMAPEAPSCLGLLEYLDEDLNRRVLLDADETVSAGLIARGNRHFRWVDARVIFEGLMAKKSHASDLLQFTLEKVAYGLCQGSECLNTKLEDRGGNERKKPKLKQAAEKLRINFGPPSLVQVLSRPAEQRLSLSKTSRSGAVVACLPQTSTSQTSTCLRVRTMMLITVTRLLKMIWTRPSHRRCMEMLKALWSSGWVLTTNLYVPEGQDYNASSCQWKGWPSIISQPVDDFTCSIFPGIVDEDEAPEDDLDETLSPEMLKALFTSLMSRSME